MNSIFRQALLVTCCLAAVVTTAHATEDSKSPSKSVDKSADKANDKADKQAPKPKQVATNSAEEQVLKALESVTSPGAVDSIRKAGYGNFYEVVLSNGEIIYADETGSYFFNGPLIDIKAKRNVTQARESELLRINFADLPLSQSIKQVRGNGKRILVTFEDPNCGYCKKLAKDVQAMKDTTIYTFLIPILSPDSGDKSRNIWCASDKSKAWNEWMAEGKMPASANCDNPITKNSELAQKLRIKGTPTMFLVDGSRIGGYVPPETLDKMISDAGDKIAKK